MSNNSEIVLMSPNNGQLLLGIPLYTRHSEETDNYKILMQVESDKPVVYAIDCGPELDSIQFFTAEWVDKNLACLGPLNTTTYNHKCEG